MDQVVTDLINGKPLRGWLRKHGGVVRGWQRRYFVLKKECLFCFMREDDTRITHTYLLDEYCLNELPASTDDPDKFSFELLSEKQPSESVTLCATSEEERKMWVKALCYSIYAQKGGAIFGLPLEEAMKMEHKLGRKIPYIVEACIEHLEKYAMETEGIFRLAGRAGLLKELRSQFETAQHPPLDKIDVHTVASLLKAYLRELPESLIPPGMYQRAMNCAMRYSEHKLEDDQLAEVKSLAQLLWELSDDSYNTLSYICQFLHRLATNVSKTKMDARNLALIFGPNLIRHLDNNPELMMMTADLTQHLAYMMIHHYSKVFLPRLESDQKASSSVVPRPHDAKPRPTNLCDLVGLEFNSAPVEISKNDSPFVLVEDHFKYRDEQCAGQQVPQQDDGAMCNDTSNMDNGSVDADVTRRPIAPRRTKSRMSRQRRSCGTPTSPVSGEWPSERRQLDAEDVKTALSNRSQTSLSDSSESTSINQELVGRPESGQNSDGEVANLIHAQESQQDMQAFTADSQGKSGRETGNVAEEQTSRRADSSIGGVHNGEGAGIRSEDGKLGPSRACLESQVAALKSELVNTKTRSDHLISMMKAQLMDMREKYENRIRTMENQHRSQVTDLAAKLDAERTACAEAVQRTVALQNQLYKYKLLYGDLKD
ncbi:hypothetical protein C0Q70_00075 [Pomacea canaliculata]|uniref:Rho-GAP domain-containing protein n=1 Tax=Pomacea canaliculata TaxID=400727 RepID=A0A2T7PVM7_POMCA|nr:hypothetical protein C0Q70_00075 [Pomacea canaliculata]